METQDVRERFVFDPRSPVGRGLIKSGLWMRTGFIGACMAVVGVQQLVSGEMKPLTALAIAIAGGVLAVAAWRFSQAALEAADAATVTTADVAPAAPSLAME